MTFRSLFMMLVAMNPIPDGASRNSPREIQNHLGRVSRPLLDRQRFMRGQFEDAFANALQSAP